MAPKNVDDIYPLTPMQRLMLLHEVSAGQRGVLANQICYEVRGALAVDSLENAVQRLVVRHPALRTGVLWERVERPLQVVRRDVRVPFVVEDLTHLPEADRDAEAEALRARDERTPFEVARAPLLRFLVLRLGPDHHRLIWTVHHLVADRWSFDLLMQELGTLYDTLASDRSPDLAPAPPFRNYVAWLQERDAAASRRYWRTALEGLEGATLLAPAPRDGADRHTTRRSLTEAETADLESAAGSWRVSLTVPVLAAVAAEAGRRTGRRDVTLGLTVAGRPAELEGVEEIIGSFVNNVPARFQLDPDRALSEWMQELQRTPIERMPHEHVSLDQIQGQAPDATGALFDLLVVTNLTRAEHPEWQGVRMTPVRATLDAGFPLVLQAARVGDRLELTLVHDAGFDAEGLLRGVVEACVALAQAAPGARLAAVVDVAEPDRPGGILSSDAEDAWGSDPANARIPPGVAGLVRRTWCQILGVDSAEVDDDFFALGGTSLQGARLLARLEETLGRPVPMAALAAGRTLGAVLEAAGAPDDDSGGSLVVLRDGGVHAPIVAVPGARGNLLLFTRLVDHLSPRRSLYGLQSRGVDVEETPLTDMGEIADDFITRLEPLGDGPIHLFGICWGAAAALEMAIRLEARGRPPLSLSLLDPAALEEGLVGDGPANVPGKLGFVLNRAHLYWRDFMDAEWKDRREFVAQKGQALARMVRSRSLDSATRQELRSTAVLEANLAALNGFRLAATEIPTRLFLSRDFEIEGDSDPRRDWSTVLQQPRGVVHVSGWDAASVTQHHSPELAAALDTWFDEADGAPAAGAPAS
ncbi:MAG: hypothetical protein KJP18_14900 [Gemmatimonadetes bacterium]|nr:hypothetical protein [Gemmatimonadota bacterium]